MVIIAFGISEFRDPIRLRLNETDKVADRHPLAQVMDIQPGVPVKVDFNHSLLPAPNVEDVCFITYECSVLIFNE